MKNILMIAGAIFILLIVTLAVLVGIVATKGGALDRESKQYADTAMRAILSSWDERQLLDRANSELLKSIARQGGPDALFAQWRHLGKMLRFDGSKGQANISLILGAGESVTAVYVASANFEHGTAHIRISMIRQNGIWRILGFWVYGSLSSAAYPLKM